MTKVDRFAEFPQGDAHLYVHGVHGDIQYIGYLTIAEIILFHQLKNELAAGR